eukprot:PhF_6_TR38601/c0_g1_i1/m.57431
MCPAAGRRPRLRTIPLLHVQVCVGVSGSGSQLRRRQRLLQQLPPDPRRIHHGTCIVGSVRRDQWGCVGLRRHLLQEPHGVRHVQASEPHGVDVVGGQGRLHGVPWSRDARVATLTR